MEKDRVSGQNGKDGMVRPSSVGRDEYEKNFDEWLKKVREQRKQEEQKKK